MPDLTFRVEGADAVREAAAPLIAFNLRISNAPASEAIEAILLRCQIQVDAPQRSYAASEQKALRDLFGEPGDWHRTLRTLLWGHANVTVPPFTGSVVVDLPLPCTYDFNVAITKYVHALDAGDIPLTLLFSGTTFYDVDGALQVSRVAWSKEARFALPVRVWKDLMAIHHPNDVFISLRKDAFARLYDYKVARGLPTWEHVVESLLPSGDRSASK